MARSDKALMPLDVTDHVGPFDRFAGWMSDLSTRAPFFAFCLLLVIIWLVEGAVKVATSGPAAFLDDKYQLQINTTTTIITFLMVALLNNSGKRDGEATQHKLNAVARGLSTLLDHHGHDEERQQLERAVGLERYESTS